MKKGLQNVRSGFTLAELLASMMVFSIIMLACANLVNQASLSFKLGLNQVESQDTGRVMTQELFRSLSGAVTANLYPFMVKKDFGQTLQGGTPDAIFLVTSSAVRLSEGSIQEIVCWVESEPADGKNGTSSKNRGKLYMRNIGIGGGGPNGLGNVIYDTGFRSEIGRVFASGTSVTDDQNSYASLMAENIWSFDIRVYDINGVEVNGDYDSKVLNNELPARVDFEMQILDEETWAKHASPEFANLALKNLKTIRFSHSYANKGTWR